MSTYSFVFSPVSPAGFQNADCRQLLCVSLSLSLSPHLSVSRLHVSPGQQAGAVGIDEVVAMGTEGWDVSGGGKAGT